MKQLREAYLEGLWLDSAGLQLLGVAHLTHQGGEGARNLAGSSRLEGHEEAPEVGGVQQGLQCAVHVAGVAHVHEASAKRAQLHVWREGGQEEGIK